MNSEAIPHTHPDDEPNNLIALSSRTRNNAEIIDFSKASTEMATSMFLTELRHPSRTGLRGAGLAEFIDGELSGPDGDPASLKTRLSRVVEAANVFANDELYDHKADHDPVFQQLIEKLQNTKSDKHLRDQRKAALKLTELRAALHDDVTEDDESWYGVVNRLFT